jgi:hypothetical protein
MADQGPQQPIPMTGTLRTPHTVCGSAESRRPDKLAVESLITLEARIGYAA